MILGNLGKVKVSETAVVVGEHFFTETMPLKDGMKNLFAGTILNIEGESKDTSAVVIVFGRVKRESLVFKDGTAVTNAQVEALRKNGIYATKGEK